jgi:hypothetical protein
VTFAILDVAVLIFVVSLYVAFARSIRCAL